MSLEITPSERRVRVPFGGDRRNLASVVALAAARAVGDAWRAPGVVDGAAAAKNAARGRDTVEISGAAHEAHARRTEGASA